eukprot:scaffold3165_cov380-Prasinococcus_capsulatus_cf.AAC.12
MRPSNRTFVLRFDSTHRSTARQPVTYGTRRGVGRGGQAAAARASAAHLSFPSSSTPSTSRWDR